MQSKPNQYEVAARAEKARALAGAILVDALIGNEDPFTVAFAEKLANAGLDFWQSVAAKSGQHFPGPETRAGVVTFFRASAEKRTQMTPTQAGAEA